MNSTAIVRDDHDKSLGEINKEKFDQAAAQAFNIPWVTQLCNGLSEHLRNNFDWIGVQSKPSASRMRDYACGNGVASRALAQHFPVVRGMDISSKMVEQYHMVAEKIGFSRKKMRAVQGDLMNPEATPCPQSDTPEFNSFDLIVMCMALHHVEDYASMVQRLSEKLGHGGVLLIVDWVAISESGCPGAPKARELSRGTMSSRMGCTKTDVKLAFEKAGLDG